MNSPYGNLKGPCLVYILMIVVVIIVVLLATGELKLT